ncbi:hypothetical protein SK128_025304, partial [Halocaridina rubra]
LANPNREAVEAGATLITKTWVVNKLCRSVRWVSDNKKKGYDNVHTTFGSDAQKNSPSIAKSSLGCRVRSDKE